MAFLNSLVSGIRQLYSSAPADPIEQAAKNLYGAAHTKHERQAATIFANHLGAVGVQGPVGYANARDAAYKAMGQVKKLLDSNEAAVFSAQFSNQLLGMFRNTRNYEGKAAVAYERFSSAVESRTLQDAAQPAFKPIPSLLSRAYTTVSNTVSKEVDRLTDIVSSAQPLLQSYGSLRRRVSPEAGYVIAIPNFSLPSGRKLTLLASAGALAFAAACATKPEYKPVNGRTAAEEQYVLEQDVLGPVAPPKPGAPIPEPTRVAGARTNAEHLGKTAETPSRGAPLPPAKGVVQAHRPAKRSAESREYAEASVYVHKMEDLEKLARLRALTREFDPHHAVFEPLSEKGDWEYVNGLIKEKGREGARTIYVILKGEQPTAVAYENGSLEETVANGTNGGIPTPLGHSEPLADASSESKLEQTVAADWKADFEAMKDGARTADVRAIVHAEQTDSPWKQDIEYVATLKAKYGDRFAEYRAALLAWNEQATAEKTPTRTSNPAYDANGPEPKALELPAHKASDLEQLVFSASLNDGQRMDLLSKLDTAAEPGSIWVEPRQLKEALDTKYQPHIVEHVREKLRTWYNEQAQGPIGSQPANARELTTPVTFADLGVETPAAAAPIAQEPEPSKGAPLPGPKAASGEPAVDPQTPVPPPRIEGDVPAFESAAVVRPELAGRTFTIGGVTRTFDATGSVAVGSDGYSNPNWKLFFRQPSK